MLITIQTEILKALSCEKNSKIFKKKEVSKEIGYRILNI